MVSELRRGSESNGGGMSTYMHAIMQGEGGHATYSQAVDKIYHSCTHTNYDNQIRSDTNIELKDDKENIQASESIRQIKR